MIAGNPGNFNLPSGAGPPPPVPLGPGAVLARSPDLAPFRRPGKLLLLAAESGSSCLLEGAALELFRALVRPTSLGQLALQGVARGQDLAGLVSRLYHWGVITVGGRRCPPPACPRPAAAPGVAVLLHLVAGCSAACPRCPSSAQAMPPERAGQAVERALTELRQRPLTVVLGGAEPLLAGPTLQAALAAARPRDAETTLVVQTRGEHLDAARVEELQKAGARVLVCLHQVPGGTLQENLYRALEAGLPLVPAGIAGSAEQVLEFYERFLEMGFRTFRISPAPRLAGGPARMAAEEAEAFAQAYLEMADRAADYLRSSRGRLRISDLDVLVRRAIWPGLREEARGLSVDLGGDLYPFETWHLPDPAPARLGSLDDPRPLARMLEESDFLASLDRRSASSIGRCRTCPFRRLCEGGSALKALSAGDVMAPDPNCRFRQRVIEGLLWRLHQEPQVAAALAGLSAPPVPGPRG